MVKRYDMFKRNPRDWQNNFTGILTKSFLKLTKEMRPQVEEAL